MMVDKNLFLYDLAVVAILKNEGHYLKEWLDYHLLAGVEHFYLYDNDSTDNQAEVAKPYIKAGLVDYFYLPGKGMQMVAYNDAVKKFKFQCRYMAFIDGDEFIYPKTNQSIVEVVDEILSDTKNPGLAIHWHCFGSHGQRRADYSRDVLERFTYRAPNDWAIPWPTQLIGGNPHIKTIANPRTINFIQNSHSASYFGKLYAINELGKPVLTYFNKPVTAERIVVNHYHTKSREEYKIKTLRGSAADTKINKHDENQFNLYDQNDEFDDGILKYRNARTKVYQPPDDKAHRRKRILKALSFMTTQDFSGNKVETLLTCRAVSAYLNKKSLEETSLAALLKSLDEMTLAEAQLLIRELPNLLRLPYPVVKDLRAELIRRLPQLMDALHSKKLWREFVGLDYLMDLLKE